VAAVYDDKATLWGTKLLGVPVTGPIARLRGPSLNPAIIAIGDNRLRRRFASELNLGWMSVVHPHAWVDPSVQLGPGTVIFAGAVVQPDAVLGAHVIVNTGATVDHDCRLADFVHIAPGAHLAGGVSVAEGAMLGIGSAAIPGATVGRYTTVGAGGVVIDNLPDEVVAVGCPALAIRSSRR
jgi:sugar O-acyltransferase (sialic acid O-acetyltransferase NeuD family)